MNSTTLLRKDITYIVGALLLCAALFIIFEPVVSRSQSATDEFTITQTIDSEISFSVATPDVVMVGSINGLTGGYATGTTQAVVTTNDPDGYTLAIRFPYATTSGMQADVGTSSINNYTPAAAGVPDYDWVDNLSGEASEFGYSVRASTTADLDPSFLDNGTDTCGVGSADGAYNCWLNASTSDETIINRTSGAAGSGATSTLIFKVAVPSSPSPSLDSGNYTATATLTATVN